MQFTILDGQSGDVLFTAPGSRRAIGGCCAELCREVARRGRPEFIEEEGPLLTLALPVVDASGNPMIAVATFLTRHVGPTEDLSGSAELLGMGVKEFSAWARRQTPWTPAALKRISDLVLDHLHVSRRARDLQQEADSLSINLASTYEEISLLYRLTQNLKLSKSDEDLGRIALEWMKEVVPAAGLVIQLVPLPGAGKSPGHAARTQPGS